MKTKPRKPIRERRWMVAYNGTFLWDTRSTRASAAAYAAPYGDSARVVEVEIREVVKKSKKRKAASA